MSNARKLQTEIDRVMKKVDEGVELFDEIWEKVYSAVNQSQKEKYEMDLKKEIKKLQRLRDQIKSWIGSSDVKDKEPLIEARKLIETKMEAFKTCEKETKTKAYSKEGLLREEQLSPEEQAKQNTSDWISDIIERLQKLVEEAEVEVEQLQVGKGKKSNKHLIEEFNHTIGMHKYHIMKLEGIMRLVNNDVLDVEIVDPIKDDVEYYLDSYQDDEYLQVYDEDFFYESLGLDELEVVNVDRVTNVPAPTTAKVKADQDEVSKSSKGSSKDAKKTKKAANSLVIPLTIGRARVSKTGKGEKESHHRDSSMSTTYSDDDQSTGRDTPSKQQMGLASKRDSSVVLMPTPTTIPAVRASSTVTTASNTGGASMAAILKRETEQQEMERQQKAEQLRQQQAQQAAILKQQQLQQQAELVRQQQQKAEELRQQQEGAAKQKALQEQHQAALRKQQQHQQQQQQQAEKLRQQQAAAAAQQKQQQQQQQQQEAISVSSLPGVVGSVGNGSGAASTVAGFDIISGLGGLSLTAGGSNNSAITGTLNTMDVGGGDPAAAAAAAAVAALGSNSAMLQESFATLPTANEQDRNHPYTPQNPYPAMPPSYPSTPSALFDNPTIFEKLGTDALFFIFYYKQGTYQQYLAARELKKQSWRFHKKYMTWFQRHEEPKITTDEYEQGTYVYFDYETGWCTRIKQDFRFEYSYLEDTLQ